MEPESVAARLWPGRPIEIEPLSGGITNRNFKVLVGGDAYVLRIGGKDTELLGIDRHAEHAAALAAAAAGVGPEVVTFAAGALVTRFIGGRTLTDEEMRSPETLALIATMLKAFHDGPAVPARFDSFAVVKTYAATAAARGVEIPEAFERALAIAARIERLRGAQPLHPCHNDLLNANFIFDGERVWIVDWEYAGMGDVLFDLANFSVNNGLRPDEDDALLVAYFGTRDEAAALTAMRFMSDFREAMWGVVQQGISELDFDFVDYAQTHFDRLERTAAAPRFRAALRTLQGES